MTHGFWGDAVQPVTDPVLWKRPRGMAAGREEWMDLSRVEGFWGPARRLQERVLSLGKYKVQISLNLVWGAERIGSRGRPHKQRAALMTVKGNP